MNDQQKVIGLDILTLLSGIFKYILCTYINNIKKGGRKKNTLLFSRHVRYQGGGRPPPANKIIFFLTKCKKYSACPEYFFC